MHLSKQEVVGLYEKGAIQVVYPLQERFISQLFLVSGKDGEQTNDQPQEVVELTDLV